MKAELQPPESRAYARLLWAMDHVAKGAEGIMVVL